MLSRSLVRTRPPRVRTAVNVHPIWKASMPSSTLRPGLAHPAPALATAPIAATELAPAELAPAERAPAGRPRMSWRACVWSRCLTPRRLMTDRPTATAAGRRWPARRPAEDPGLARAPAAGTRGLGSPASGPAAALAVVIVEALAGVRPERQLLPLTTDRVRARIRGLTPLLRCDQRPRVLRILASQPAPRVDGDGGGGGVRAAFARPGPALGASGRPPGYSGQAGAAGPLAVYRDRGRLIRRRRASAGHRGSA